MKKLLSYLLFIAFIFSFSVCFNAADTVTISAENAAGRIGDTVEIPISVSANSNFGNMRIDVSFDNEKLEYVGFSQTDAIAGLLVAVKQNPQSVAVGIISANAVNDGGVLLFMSFKIKSGSVQEKIAVSLDVPEIVDGDTDSAILCNTQAGEVTVKETVLGDINGDGSVMLDDAMSAFLYVAHKQTLEGSSFFAADMNEDGCVTLADSIKIFLTLRNK